MSSLTKRLLTRSYLGCTYARAWLSLGLGGGGFTSLGIGYWGCTAEWDRIFTTGLTVLELHFHLSY